MRRTEIRVERTDAFFGRGREYARLADRGTRIPASRVVAFEDIESFLRVLTRKRVLLLRQLNETPCSISELARSLKRDRSAVTRDVQILEGLGVLKVSDEPLPGHGRQKLVGPIARDIHLVAKLT